MNTNLKQYQEGGFPSIEGWCADQLFDAVDLLDGVPINKKGGCMEIGVHHGKFYILLNQVVAAGETSYAVDIFEEQNLNIDQSGSGSLERFQANLVAHDVHRGANTIIVKGDSTDAGLALDQRIRPGSLRFISVDGGHTVEHTVNDLQIAARLVANEGVVILDDILNHHWPGVIEGAFRFLATSPVLVPFALGHNKLYLCKLSFQAYYCNLFSASHLFTKAVRFHGHTVAAL